MMNFTTLACGRYLRINMTSAQPVYLERIEVLGTSRYIYMHSATVHQEIPGIYVNTIVVLSRSQMMASTHIHPQLAAILLAQSLQSAQLIQSHLPVSERYSVYCAFIYQLV